MSEFPFVSHILTVGVSLFGIVSSNVLFIQFELFDCSLVELANAELIFVLEIFVVLNIGVSTLNLLLVYIPLHIIVLFQRLKFLLAHVFKRLCLLVVIISSSIILFSDTRSLIVQCNLLMHLRFFHGQLFKPVFK